jgi:NADH:ubiquinone oxidoreductase subunit E
MELDIPPTEDTTEDRRFTVERVACVGTCSMAPVVIINKKVYGKVVADKIVREIKSLEKMTGGDDE